MFSKRKFILTTMSFAGVAAFAPLVSVQAFTSIHNLSMPSKDRFNHLHHKWLGLYDVYGNFLSDIKLIKDYDDSSDAQVEQFSQIWQISNDDKLPPGMYVIDDFATTPMNIYLEPSEEGKKGNCYRALYSILRK